MLAMPRLRISLCEGRILGGNFMKELEIIDKVEKLLKESEVEKATETLREYRSILTEGDENKSKTENEEFEWFLSKLDSSWGHPNSDILDFSDKEIWVYWSGGFDSTALVTALWRKYKKTIHTFSVFHEWIPNKYADRNARKRLLKEFKKRNWDIENHELELKDEYVGDNNGLGQPPIWLAALAIAARGNNRVYCYGYVQGDDFWHYVAPFKGVFEGVCQILGNKNSMIAFPLEFVDKVDIIRYIQQEKLDGVCSYCEQETDELADEEPCGCCHSCERHQSALREIEMMMGGVQTSESVEDIKGINQ